jgi:hypothetical protein
MKFYELIPLLRAVADACPHLQTLNLDVPCATDIMELSHWGDSKSSREVLMVVLARFKYLRHLSITDFSEFNTDAAARRQMNLLPSLQSLHVDTQRQRSIIFPGCVVQRFSDPHAVGLYNASPELVAKLINDSLPPTLAGKWNRVYFGGKSILASLIPVMRVYSDVEYFIQTQQATVDWGKDGLLDLEFIRSFLRRPFTSMRHKGTGALKPELIDWVRLTASAFEPLKKEKLTRDFFSRLLIEAATQSNNSFEELLPLALEYGVAPGSVVDKATGAGLLVLAAWPPDLESSHYGWNIYQLVKNDALYGVRESDTDKFGFTALHHCVMCTSEHAIATRNLSMSANTLSMKTHSGLTAVTVATIANLPELIKRRLKSSKKDFVVPKAAINEIGLPEDVRERLAATPHLLLRLAACLGISDEQFRKWCGFFKQHFPQCRKLDITPLVEYFESIQEESRTRNGPKNPAHLAMSEEYLKQTITTARRLRIVSDEFSINVYGKNVHVWINL